jgi:Shedu protein SduA, C-terminal
LAGAVTQALNYRLSLLNDLHGLQAQSRSLNVHFPSIFVLIGDSEREDMSEAQRRSFELFRSSLKDVVIQTYDELFNGIANLAVWMEPP